MSVATPPPTTTPTGASTGPPVDAACPLCGAPLDPAQEWCLSCGAAARTRLAAPTNWKAPIVAIAVIATLALGVLAAALVKLSGGNPTTKAVAPVTRTIVVATTPTTSTIPTTPGAVPTTVTPTTTTPSTPGTSPGGTIAPTTTSPTPGTPTTSTPFTPTGTTGAPTATTTTPGATTPTTTGAGSKRANEEALRKAGFLPRTKK